MTEAEAAIADLDAALAEVGEDVPLQRMTLGPNGLQIPFEAKCRAVVRGYTPQELIAGSGIQQGDSLVILSPTDIEKAQWPGAQVGTPVGDVRVPLPSRDKIVIQGKQRAIIAAVPFYTGGELVRIELQARG